MDHPPIFYKIVGGIALWLAVTSPALAQGPSPSTYDMVVNAVAPVVDFLDDYSILAMAPLTATSAIWGGQLLSTADTGQGPGSATPPADYYPDAPAQIRQSGYTMESLATADIGAMSALDFAHWLGISVALPFQLARGMQGIVTIIGPMGIFLSWLMLATLWVGIIYFLSFLAGFIGNLLELGSKIVEIIGLVKP
jgi:hypothetical protein